MRRIRFLLVVAIAVVLFLIAVPTYAAPPAGPAHGGSTCTQWYTVQCGDTLAKIASWYGTSVWALAQRNGIPNINKIYAGQVLCVRWGGPPPPPPPPPPHPGGFWYRVQPGDMLRIIAARYGWGTWYLANVNHIPNPDVIYVGQMLWIPAH
jgi:LysM repeat protein